MSLGYTDIPYNQQISLDSPTLDLQIEEVSIVFEFLEVGAGSLSVQWARESNVRDRPHRVIDILDIPCETEMRVSPDCSSTLTFLLKLYEQRFVWIVFTWGEINSVDKEREETSDGIRCE
jgi:hypothetical protein